MKKITFWIIVFSAFLFHIGCSTGTLPYGGATTTDLTRKNFRMIRASARGQDSGFYLLGFIPFSSPTYADAMRNLYEGVDVEGKATTLAHVAQDRSTVYLILFSIPKITVTADIIEFIDE
jgi:hypothetical protein